MAEVAYWEEYHKVRWEAYRGPEQSRYFASLILAHLPQRIKDEIARCATLCDFGCAHGDGTALFAQGFPRAVVTGVDFSSRAIEKARERFPHIQFICDSKPDRFYNAIIASNVLEHYSDWFAVLRGLLAYTRQFVIVLVPYREQYPLCEDHRVTFDEFTFPEVVQFVPSAEMYRSGRWHLCYQEIIPTERFWNGAQLLVVYRREL